MNYLSSRFRSTAIVLIILMIPVLSNAWGKEGHEVIADVAQHYLNKTASEKVQQLLAVMHADNMAEVASFADEYRHSHPETGPWHYVDIPLKAHDYVPSRDCPDKKCVIDIIYHFKQILNNNALDDSTRAYALAFLIHFVGDLHQPLHASDNHDKGGNEVEVSFLGHRSNLHRVWDTNIISHQDTSAANLARTILTKYKDVKIKPVEKGSIVSWALQAHREAQKIAYGKLPKNRKIGKAYIKAAQPVVDKQLYRAGVRLAHILDQILG